jgi:hypothetical protein
MKFRILKHCLFLPVTLIIGFGYFSCPEATSAIQPDTGKFKPGDSYFRYGFPVCSKTL